MIGSGRTTRCAALFLGVAFLVATAGPALAAASLTGTLAVVAPALGSTNIKGSATLTVKNSGNTASLATSVTTYVQLYRCLTSVCPGNVSTSAAGTADQVLGMRLGPSCSVSSLAAGKTFTCALVSSAYSCKTVSATATSYSYYTRSTYVIGSTVFYQNSSLAKYAKGCLT